MKKATVIFGTNTAPFIRKMQEKYLKPNITMHFYDYILIIDGKLEMQSNDLQVISQALGDQECTLITKSEFVNQ